MKRYLLSFLGAVALALTVGSAKPMLLTFDAGNGRLLDSSIHTPSMVNASEARYIRCLNDVLNTSANIQIFNNGSGGVVILYLTW